VHVSPRRADATGGGRYALQLHDWFLRSWRCIRSKLLGRRGPSTTTRSVASNVLAGYLAWPDYRGQNAPNAIKINHHKNSATVWHPLQETTEAGTIAFYGDAETVLARLPRRGVAMILKARRDGTTEPYTAMQMSKIVRKLRVGFFGVSQRPELLLACAAVLSETHRRETATTLERQTHLAAYSFGRWCPQRERRKLIL
jgi:hypothetical protein